MEHHTIPCRPLNIYSWDGFSVLPRCTKKVLNGVVLSTNIITQLPEYNEAIRGYMMLVCDLFHHMFEHFNKKHLKTSSKISMFLQNLLPFILD